jgi:hypothetical protein
MPVAIVPVLTSVLVGAGLSAVTAGIVANVAIIAVGLGLQLLVSTIFKPTQPKPSDGQTIIRQSAASRFRSYGRVKVAGIMMFANTKGGALDRVFALGSGEIDAVEEHWIDDQLVTLDGGGGVGGKYAGKCRIKFRLGTDAPAPYTELIAAWPALWTTDHLGKGVPSAHMQQFQVKAEQMGDLWPNLANTGYRQVQRGAKVRALSGGFLPAAWNDNAALVIMDYLTHPDGLGLDDSWIVNAFESWGVAQLVCDEFVPLAAGGEERRYRIWNTYRFDERPADVLARFLQACDATIYPTPGQGLSIKVGKWEAPTVTIDDDAVVAFSEVGRGRDVLTTANTVRAQFMSPVHDYQETDAQVWVDSADVAARGEYAIDLEFFAAPSHAQCRRLMKIAAHRSNPDWVGTLVCNLRALPVMGERFINVELDELGISDTFEVLNARMIIEEGNILKGIEVQVASLTAAAYAWDPVEEEGEAPAEPDIIVGENEIPVPTGFGVGPFGDGAVIAWAVPPDDFLVVDARYKRTADADWLAIPVADDATAAVIAPLVDGEEYEFQIRHRSTPTGRVSDWTASETVIFDDMIEDYGHITDTAVTIEDYGHITDAVGTIEDYERIV